MSVRRERLQERRSVICSMELLETQGFEAA
jgi:hypothetical protein